MNARRLSVVMISSTHAVSEILLLRVAAEVLEPPPPQHSTGRRRVALGTL